MKCPKTSMKKRFLTAFIFIFIYSTKNTILTAHIQHKGECGGKILIERL